VVAGGGRGGGATVTLVDFEDAARLILGKAQSLLGCPGTSSNPPVSLAMKDAACVFMKEACQQPLHFAVVLQPLRPLVLQTARTDLEASCDDACRSPAPESSPPTVTTNGLQFSGQDAMCRTFNNLHGGTAKVRPKLHAEGFTVGV